MCVCGKYPTKDPEAADPVYEDQFFGCKGNRYEAHTNRICQSGRMKSVRNRLFGPFERFFRWASGPTVPPFVTQMFEQYARDARRAALAKTEPSGHLRSVLGAAYDAATQENTNA